MVMPCVSLGMMVEFIQQLVAPESRRHSSVFGRVSVFFVFVFVKSMVIGISSGACFFAEGQ